MNLRYITSILLFPGVLVAAMSASLLGPRLGWGTSATVFGTLTGVGLVLLLFERILPYRPEWNETQGDVGTDLLHLALTQITLSRLLEAGLLTLLAAGTIRISAWAGGSIWPNHWPLLVQLTVALLGTDLIRYWLHRATHTIPLLWRFHAVHHSPDRLYWLNASRFHPLDEVLHTLPVTIPLALAGADARILALYFVFSGLHGLFQHANIELRLGPLNYVFSMAELHRWHHSRDVEEANKNFGNNLILWDLVFGTFYHPRDRDAPPVGIHGLEMPRSYLGQILSPIQWSRLGKPDAEENTRIPCDPHFVSTD